ncbi:hypothetical protein ACFSUJ_34580 [Streptomyces lusitanus]|uniref:ABC transporter permease subunit n=1 Tax=Streptomyces lusitanus TaxID=68232 RepID=UPI00362A3679
MPLALLVISGYLDLSVGSTLAVGGLVAGWLAGQQHQPPVVAVLGALAVGAAVGAVNGILCCYLGLSAFIVTLGMLTAVRGLAQQLFPLPLSSFGSGFAWSADRGSRGSTRRSSSPRSSSWRVRCSWRSPRPGGTSSPSASTGRPPTSPASTSAGRLRAVRRHGRGGGPCRGDQGVGAGQRGRRDLGRVSN